MKISKMIVVGALVGTLSYSDVVNAVSVESMKKHHHHHKKDNTNVAVKGDDAEKNEEAGAGPVTDAEKKAIADQKAS